MELLVDMEFDYVEALDLNSSGHTDATTMTYLSEDRDEDEYIGRMLEEENFPDHFIDTACLDPPFLSSNTMPTSTTAGRNSSRAWSTFSNIRNSSLGSLFGNSIGSPPLSSTEAPPSLRSISCSSASYNTDSGAFYREGPLNQQYYEIKKSAVGTPPPVPIPKPFRLRRKSSSSSRGKRGKRKGPSQHPPSKEASSPGLVGELLAFENMRVSPPVSPTPKKGKISCSPRQSPLSRMKQGILSMKKLAGGGGPKTKQPEPKPVKTKKNDTVFTNPAAADFPNNNNPKKKRTRRKEPLQKQYVSITDMDVLLGRGGASNHHPGNLQYRKHILMHQQEYKLLENSAKTQMSIDVVEWVKSRGGRFLKRDDDVEGKSFYVATDGTARQKVSQALREDHTPEGRKLKKSRTKSFKK